VEEHQKLSALGFKKKNMNWRQHHQVYVDIWDEIPPRDPNEEEWNAEDYRRYRRWYEVYGAASATRVISYLLYLRQRRSLTSATFLTYLTDSAQYIKIYKIYIYMHYSVISNIYIYIIIV
jgi:hypothetical protein